MKQWLAFALAMLWVGTASAGMLDASWTAPTTNTDGSALTDLIEYRLYYGPTVQCPGASFQSVPSSTMAPPADLREGYRLTGLTTGQSYSVQVTAVNIAGNESACSAMATAVANAEPPIVGDNRVLVGSECCNANVMLANRAVLATPGTLQSLSIHAQAAAGQVRLGIYTDSGGVPGTRVAQTAAFIPVLGWNTVSVTPTSLPIGTYWLVVMPSDVGFTYTGNRTEGTTRAASFAFGSMPTTFPSPSNGPFTGQWSLYGTLATTGPNNVVNFGLTFTP